MGFGAAGFQQDRFDLGGKDVHTPDDHHIIGTTAHLFHLDQAPAAFTGIPPQAGDVPGAIPDYRRCFLGEGCIDNFPEFTLGAELPFCGSDGNFPFSCMISRNRVHDLWPGFLYISGHLGEHQRVRSEKTVGMFLDFCNIFGLGCDMFIKDSNKKEQVLKTPKKETAMRKILFLSLLLTFFSTASIWAADVSGTWVLKYSGSQGDERVLDLVIEASGENLTVATTHPALGEMAGTGTLTGSEITMTLAATGERAVTFELKGTVDGDKMTGTREVNAPERTESEGAQRGARGDSSEGSSQRGARGDSSAGAEEGAQGRGSGTASRGDSSQAGERSNTWTAEKK